ncbi:MAG: tetratricopeptide repeat protein, partial [Flavobacteriales bacterium]
MKYLTRHNNNLPYMKFIYLLFINLSLNLASCQTKTDNVKLSEKNVCTIFYKKFREAVVSENAENALTYIDQAIKCDPTNESFKSNKLRFLIELGKYEKAIELINNFNSNDTSFKMLKAVLKLKIKDSDSKGLLKQCYNEYRSAKKITSDN